MISKLNRMTLWDQYGELAVVIRRLFCSKIIDEYWRACLGDLGFKSLK